MAYVTDRKRVTGLGAAKSGTHHFWTMTVTAVALFVLTPFFLGVIGPLLGAPHEEVIATTTSPNTPMTSSLSAPAARACAPRSAWPNRG
jgi:succinate dehydrogenase / fumarate reductase membrane anchor subunit